MTLSDKYDIFNDVKRINRGAVAQRKSIRLISGRSRYRNSPAPPNLKYYKKNIKNKRGLNYENQKWYLANFRRWNEMCCT